MIPIISRSRDVGGNPGDMYICWGLQYMLRKVRPNAPHLILSKFNDKDFSHYNKYIKQAGHIVYAGMPQYNNLDDWCFFYDWEMFKKYLIPWKVRLRTVAGGSGFPSTDMSPKQFADHLVNNKRTLQALNARKRITDLCTVRDEHSYAALKAIGQDVHLLPCTATWAAKWLDITPTDSNVVGLVPPGPGNFKTSLVGASDSTKAMVWLHNYFNQITKELKQHGLETQIICHSEKEYEYFRRDKNAYYSNDLHCLLKHYGGLHGVISARLHGALPVAGMRKHSVLLGIDTRQSAAKPLGVPLIAIDKADAAGTAAAYLASPKDYSAVMDAAEEKYLGLLDKVLP